MSHRNRFTEDYVFEVRKTYRGGYSISLPHQCDEWEIIGADDDSIENDDSYPACPKSKEIAVKQMKLFCRRAKEALERLESLD